MKATARSFATLMRPAHLAAARDLGYVLTLGTTDGWLGFSTLIQAKLDVRERAALAYAALRSLDPDLAARVAAAFNPAGPPLPVLFDPIEDAAWWVALATPEELRAYCLAAYLRMPRPDQRAFIEFAQGSTT